MGKKYLEGEALSIEDGLFHDSPCIFIRLRINRVSFGKILARAEELNIHPEAMIVRSFWTAFDGLVRKERKSMKAATEGIPTRPRSYFFPENSKKHCKELLEKFENADA